MKSNVAFIAPINTRDGIARYTKNLVESIEEHFANVYVIAPKLTEIPVYTDDENVFRLWGLGSIDTDKILAFLKEYNVHIVHIQYHSSYYYDPEVLSDLIDRLADHGINVFVTLHMVQTKRFNYLERISSLQRASKVLIHNEKDYEFARAKLNNVIHFPHPVSEYKLLDKSTLRENLGITKRPVIGTHGILNSNKNIPTIIEAIKILKEKYPNILLLALNAVVPTNSASFGEYERVLKLVEEYGLENNVTFVPEFINRKQLEILLQIPDVFVFAYSDVGESASGAVREVIASGGLPIVNAIKAYEDFQSEVLKYNSLEADEIARTVINLLESEEKQEKIKKSGKMYMEEFSYQNMSKKLITAYG